MLQLQKEIALVMFQVVPLTTLRGDGGESRTTVPRKGAEAPSSHMKVISVLPKTSLVVGTGAATYPERLSLVKLPL